MFNSVPLQDLTCTHCGSPIKTTDKPGTTITCNCCGSMFLIPEKSVPSIVVNGHNIRVNIGVQITGATIIGDVVGGDLIVTNGDVFQVGKEGKVIIFKKGDTDQSETTQ